MNYEEVKVAINNGLDVSWSRESNRVVVENVEGYDPEYFVQVPNGKKIDLESCNKDGFFVVDAPKNEKRFVGVDVVREAIEEARFMVVNGIDGVSAINFIADKLEV